MLRDCVSILAISLLSALLAEGISWLLIYRTEDYKRLKSSIDKLQKKVDKKKEVAASTKGGKDKKLDRYEESLKNWNRDMSVVKMKSMFFIAVIMISLFGFLSSTYDGIVVAKLPFVPVSLLTGLSHRNLPGNDLTDCSFIFFYILSSMSIRSNLQKILGTTPPKQQSLFPQ